MPGVSAIGLAPIPRVLPLIAKGWLTPHGGRRATLPLPHRGHHLRRAHRWWRVDESEPLAERLGYDGVVLTACELLVAAIDLSIPVRRTAAPPAALTDRLNRC